MGFSKPMAAHELDVWADRVVGLFINGWRRLHQSALFA
jgi:hypothetical protein